MGNLIVSEELAKAEDLHRKIIVSARFAQQSVAEMCMALKEMRDTELYKALGFETFEIYCEERVGMDCRHVYRYIQIAETFDDLPAVAHLGVTKLHLLAALPEDDRAAVTGAVDVETVSKRELERAIADLKAEKAERERLKAALEAEKEKAALFAPGASDPKEIEKLAAQKAAETSEKVRAQELEKFNKDRERIEAEAAAALEAFREESAREVRELRETIEKQKAASSAPADTDKEIFKAYYKSAYDALNRLLEFAGGRGVYLERIRALLASAGERTANDGGTADEDS
jgi:flagellar biosynthesis GTPase FlhF